MPYGANGSMSVFDCLVSKDTESLVNASSIISQSGAYGTWAFLPVTDGVFVVDTPSRQLLRKKVNGLNMLVGNNANEGPGFVPQTIATEEDLLAWLRLTFPLFSNNDIAKILFYYPSSNDSTTDAALYATNGESGPTAVNQSNVGTGQQQRANNIYAETTFVCPSYWLAEAYSDSNFGQGKAYKYQFSVIPALHATDVPAYFGPVGSGQFSVSFSRAFKQIWGNFVINNDPSIPQAVALGQTNSTYPQPAVENPAANWPSFTVYNPYQIDLNQTGGPIVTIESGGFNLSAETGQGAVNDFRLVNAYTWEGGRGVRCDLWRSIGDLVPE